MKYKEYVRIYRTVSEENVGNDPLLANILEKKVVRDVKRRYHVLLKNGLAKEWVEGSTVRELAEKYEFPPFLLSKMIKKQVGINKRLLREMTEAEKQDRFYSKRAAEQAAENGKEVEKEVARWLSERGAQFLRGDFIEGPLHPDILFQPPFEINGKKINWIECKYYFGSKQDMEKHWKGQLKKYKKAFGPGAIVYWLGFVEDKVPDDEHLVLSADLFTQNN